MRIIIVEDEGVIRNGLSKFIERETDYTVIGVARNGREGLEMICRLKPELIITDIRMPVMDGLEMLTEIHKSGQNVYAIILTGYAEFEYAQKAITLGVQDYVLKPVDMEQMMERIKAIETQIAEKQAKQSEPESCLRDILFGEEKEVQTNVRKFKLLQNLDETVHYVSLLGYIGAAPPAYRKEFEGRLEMAKKRFRELSVTVLYLDQTREVFCLAAGIRQLDGFLELFRQREADVYAKTEGAPFWSVKQHTRLDTVRQEFEQLQEMVSYAMVIPAGIMIDEAVIADYQTEEFIYPFALEQEVKQAICNKQGAKLIREGEQFIDYMRGRKFLVDDVKHSYIKLITYTITLLHEIDMKIYNKVQSMHLLQQAGSARTRYELEGVVKELFLYLSQVQDRKEDIRNYTIRCAINYIREHYSEAISLDEIARTMDITPEYLSTLFIKEMHINFSTFLKEFRISHAKRLLKGTDKKIYEIAKEVGYQDPKYFMRVFKEVQGVSAREYRQQV